MSRSPFDARDDDPIRSAGRREVSRLAQEIAQAAARAVVEEGLELGEARQQAVRDLGGHGVRPSDVPRNDDVEDAARELIATFHADTQPAELAALRQVALRWMQRLSRHRPHLAGAVWRGIAGRHSAIRIDLYCDDPKLAGIELLNMGLPFELGGDLDAEPGSVTVATLSDRAPGLADTVTVHLLLHDRDDQKGALKADARGRTWRGDLAAVERLLQAAPPP